MHYDARFQFDNTFFQNPKPCSNSLVYQVGEKYCGEFYDEEHHQFLYEFTYVLDGRGLVYTNGIPYPIKKYDCHWSIPDERHRITSDPDSPLRFFYIAYLSKDADIENIHSFLFGDNKLSPDKRLLHDATLKDDFLKILAEISSEDSYALNMIGLLLKIAIVKCFRLSTKSSLPVYNLDKKDSRYIAYQIANYIDRNILEITHINNLEAVFHYNGRHLARNFAKVMNMPIQKYFINKRMEKAAELLSSSDMTVTRIAELLQYSSIHSFSRSFGRFFGVSPGKFGKTLKNGE